MTPKKASIEAIVFAGYFSAVYTALWTAIESNAFFVPGQLNASGWIGQILLLSVSANVAGVAALSRKRASRLSRAATLPEAAAHGIVDGPSHDGFSEIGRAIVNQFEQLRASGDYPSILRFGVPLSRALWLEGQYETRVTIGRIVEEAAGRLSERHAQVQALIDDIGWTLVALKQLDEAQLYIRRGIEIATEAGDNYYAAKGLRHLSGIAIEERQYEDALELLVQAEGFAERISEESKRIEMFAGIRYGQAEAHLGLGNKSAALERCIKSRRLYQLAQDDSRGVKTYSQLGKILESDGDWLRAKDAYRTGLAIATDIDRRDEVIRNHHGLARIASREADHRSAAEHTAQAEAMERSTPLVFKNASTRLQRPN